MKNIILLSAIFVFTSCKGQDKDEKINLKQKIEEKIYSAKCQDKYSTGQKTSEKEKKWFLIKKDIDEIIKLSSEITENEWHFSYPVTPCNIEVKNYLYKGKKYDLFINGGSYVSLLDGKKNILLGCDSPDCSKYFLLPKESMEDENQSSSKGLNSINTKTYIIDLNKDKVSDLLIIKKNDTQFILEAEINKLPFFNKTFNCDLINIETNIKYNQTFNLILNYVDQYQKPFRKIVIPVFYKNDNFVIEKLFVATLGTSAKTGDEEWVSREITQKSSLKNLDVDLILSE